MYIHKYVYIYIHANRLYRYDLYSWEMRLAFVVGLSLEGYRTSFALSWALVLKADSGLRVSGPGISFKKHVP